MRLKIVQLFFFALPSGSNGFPQTIKCTDVRCDSIRAKAARLPSPPVSPGFPPSHSQRMMYKLGVSASAATHARNARVNPFAATHTKMAVCKSFTCHTYEKQGVFPTGLCPRSLSGIVQCEVSRRRTASDSMCPRSMASLVPSGENRNPAICSEVKCVTCRRGEPSSGCPHRLSMFFSRTRYNTDLASGANAKGGEALGSKS